MTSINVNSLKKKKLITAKIITKNKNRYLNSLSGVKMTPSFSQVRFGTGVPAAVQLSTASLPSGIVKLRKCSIKYGGLNESLSK